jgi:hypothetical protein
MADAARPSAALEAVAAGFEEVASDFTEEVGDPPTLAEFLEILGWAVPADGEATDGTFPRPLKFKAGLEGNKQYQSDQPSRVPELNDHVFVAAADHQGALVEHLNTVDGVPVSPLRFAVAVLQVLRSGKVTFSDVAGKDIHKLTAGASKQRGARPGDIVAIPARRGGYHIAVALTRNRFGTALGLFQGHSPHGRLSPDLRDAPGKYPVYTEDSMVKSGTWKIVGHDESLLAFFPAEPPIYHRPNAWPGIVDTGEFGAAETADGSMRFIDAKEAREVGLEDDTYRSSRVAAYLQELLDNRRG